MSIAEIRRSGLLAASVVIAFAASPAACTARVGPSNASLDAAVEPDAGAVVDDASAPANPTGWRKTGSLHVARRGHTATLLASGEVLVVGGERLDGTPLDSIEIYDPREERWTELAPMPAPRSNHTATLLDDGRVLIAGGGESTSIGLPAVGTATATTLFFDPKDRSVRAGPPLGLPRSHHQAVRLGGGDVLLVGGSNGRHERGNAFDGEPIADATATTERFELASRRFVPGPAMRVERFAHTVALLPSGAVLVAGGSDGKRSFETTELLDQGDGFTEGPALSGDDRMFHAMAVLESGDVLLVGGKTANRGPLSSAELLAVGGQAWTEQPRVPPPRTAATLVALPSGDALLVGGLQQTGPGTSEVVAKASVFERSPAGQPSRWRGIEPLPKGRFFHSLTVLADGDVLVTGGAEGTAGFTRETAGCLRSVR